MGVDFALLFSLGALICGATGLFIAVYILRRPPTWLRGFVKGIMTEGAIGREIRTAYPPEDVAGIAIAVVESQGAAVKQFIADEGIPMLAAIGSSEVASNARGGKSVLASAVGDLGGGAAGLQGLAALVAKPGKESGLGSLVQYLPMIQQFMATQKSQSDAPTNGGQQAPAGNYHVGGKLGGN